ncbi:hypothetical protein GCM10010109_74000 [Actinoplanes campanulatus]|nr:hypothetical protein GCM10010109_74000 [Actinoplanes campanulatus]GID39828.1 hypothetical protein Aca09nite_63340 [Actinoplanes campanulatus]
MWLSDRSCGGDPPLTPGGRGTAWSRQSLAGLLRRVRVARTGKGSEPGPAGAGPGRRGCDRQWFGGEPDLVAWGCDRQWFGGEPDLVAWGCGRQWAGGEPDLAAEGDVRRST